MAKFWLGTSGFSYRDWIGRFYPEDLPSTQWLEYYSQHFQTLELNNTFYRLPQEKTFINWRRRTPDSFVFAVKAHQRLTHWKRLEINQELWSWFWSRVCLLEDKLAVILFQLPPSMKQDLNRLTSFLTQFKPPVRLAFEFRHSSWFNSATYQVLKSFNCALVFHDAQRWPAPPLEIMADFVYIRFHGVETLYNYYYSSEQLDNWKLKIKNWLKQGLDVFAYFNNDVDGYAVKNAQELLELVENAKCKNQNPK